MIQLLAKKYRLHVVLISNGEIETEEIEFYKKNTEYYKIYQMTKLERIEGVISALVKGLPIQVGLYQSRRLFKQLMKEESGRVDILINELVRTMPYEKAFDDKVEKIFDMVDSIGLNYLKSLNKTRSPIWKLYYRIETKRLLRYEEECVRTADISFLFNQDEQTHWKKFGNVQWLPHGVKEELLFYNDIEINEDYPFLAFIGKMDYQPNIDAVLWFAEHIYSKLKKTIGFVIIGAYPTSEVRKLQEKYDNITVMGFVENPYLILSQAIAVVAPMRTGGGIQNKVLEAMAIGKVNLLSKMAAQPIIGAEDGTHFLISDSLEDYERNIDFLLKEPVKRKEIEHSARIFIKNNYTWEKYGEQYIAFLEKYRKV